MSALGMVLGTIRGIPDFVANDWCGFDERALQALADELDACGAAVRRQLAARRAVENAKHASHFWRRDEWMHPAVDVLDVAWPPR